MGLYWLVTEARARMRPNSASVFGALTPDTTRLISGLVKAGFYDGLTFHRVIPSFVIQGGDPAGTGSGVPPFTFDDEFNLNAIYSGSGQLALANSGKDTNGTQFFAAKRGMT